MDAKSASWASVSIWVMMMMQRGWKLHKNIWSKCQRNTEGLWYKTEAGNIRENDCMQAFKSGKQCYSLPAISCQHTSPEPLEWWSPGRHSCTPLSQLCRRNMEPRLVSAASLQMTDLFANHLKDLNVRYSDLIWIKHITHQGLSYLCPPLHFHLSPHLLLLLHFPYTWFLPQRLWTKYPYKMLCNVRQLTETWVHVGLYVKQSSKYCKCLTYLLQASNLRKISGATRMHHRDLGLRCYRASSRTHPSSSQGHGDIFRAVPMRNKHKQYPGAEHT